jgi:acyl-coenzyme A thioesterase PaaI-like protein
VLTAEPVVGRMPVEGNTQPMGLWHGGATCVLAETGPFRASRWDHDGAAPRGD